MPNFIAWITTRKNGRATIPRNFTPRGERGEILARFYQSTPDGMSHTVEVEQDAHPALGVLATFITLKHDTDPAQSADSVIAIRSYQRTPPLGTLPERMGVVIQTPRGRQIRLAEALQALDDYMTRKEMDRANQR
jgi:hypothetical protein